MATTYAEVPDNYSEIDSLVISDVNEIKKVFFNAERIYFYDACSFQRHSKLKKKDRANLLRYFKAHGASIFITRCILMELTSAHHLLPENYIDLIKGLYGAGIPIALFDEEYAFDVLSECFSTNERINEYLSWAVRTVKSPVSTIQRTLVKDKRLFHDVIESTRSKEANLYERFFKAVRSNKEQGDNLGEELIAICLHVLSLLPGVSDGKLCILTDDKGAAGKIDAVWKRTKPEYRGAKIILFSTPKLVQHMFQERIAVEEEELINIISDGSSGNIAVMGTTAYDLYVVKVSMTGRELVQKITEPNGISIVF